MLFSIFYMHIVWSLWDLNSVCVWKCTHTCTHPTTLHWFAYLVHFKLNPQNNLHWLTGWLVVGLCRWLTSYTTELLAECFTLYDDVKVNFSPLLNSPTLKCKLLLGHFSLRANTNVMCIHELRHSMPNNVVSNLSKWMSWIWIAWHKFQHEWIMCRKMCS